jgi:hypothetical protein
MPHTLLFDTFYNQPVALLSAWKLDPAFMSVSPRRLKTPLPAVIPLNISALNNDVPVASTQNKALRCLHRYPL